MSLGAKFASGSGWLAMGAAGDYAMQFVIFTILARLVSITELGIVAFALVLTDLGRIFVNGGRAELIVQHPDWNEDLASVAFTHTLLSSVIMALILGVLGGWLVEHYYEAGAGLPTAALAFIVVIEAFRTVHAAKMRREFKFKSLAGRAIIGTVLSGLIAVVLAFQGFGVWALVAQRLIAQLTTTALTLYAEPWRPRWMWNSPATEGTSQFTRKVTLSRVLDVAILRMPDFLIGILIGPVAVALYRVGARALEAITRIVVQPFQDASMAAYSRIGDPVAIGNTLCRICRVALLLLVPVFGGAAIVATDITVLLFGEKYLASGPIMSALAIGAVPQAMLMMISSAYLGSGRAHALFVVNSLSLVITATAITGGSLLGNAIGAAVATAIAQWLLFASALLLARHYLKVSVGPIIGGLLVPAVGVGLMVGATYLLDMIDVGSLPLLLRLATRVSAGVLAYALVMAITYRPYLRPLLKDVSSIMPGRLRRFLPN